MSISSYPQGFMNGVLIRGTPVTNIFPGKVFWVNNSSVLPEFGIGGSDGNPGTYHQPFSTVAAALSAATANRGDIIVVMPGHAESLTAAGTVTMKAGTAIVGLGTGSLRPTFNATATAGSIIGAANSLLHNVLVTGGIDACTGLITATSAHGMILSSVEVKDVTGEMVDGVVLTTCNEVKIFDHIHNGASGAGTNAGIAIVGGSRILIDKLDMDGNFAVAGIDIRTTATTDLRVRNVDYFRTRNAADIFLKDTITASTGQIGPNLNLRLNDNAANITEAITGATFVLIDPIYVVNLAGEKAMLINTTASTDA